MAGGLPASGRLAESWTDSTREAAWGRFAPHLGAVRGRPGGEARSDFRTEHVEKL